MENFAAGGLESREVCFERLGIGRVLLDGESDVFGAQGCRIPVRIGENSKLEPVLA